MSKGPDITVSLREDRDYGPLTQNLLLKQMICFPSCNRFCTELAYNKNSGSTIAPFILSIESLKWWKTCFHQVPMNDYFGALGTAHGMTD